MQTQISVKCTDQQLKLTANPTIASGGVNENVITFEFCSMWNDFKKVAVFWRDEWFNYVGKNPIPIALDENNSCVVPWEVTADAGVFFFGVLGVLGEVERTSNVLEYDVQQGTIRGEYTMPEATKDLFAQLVEKSHTHENKDVLDSITREMLNKIGTGLTEEELATAIENYLAENPISGGGYSLNVEGETLTVTANTGGTVPTVENETIIF